MSTSNPVPQNQQPYPPAPPSRSIVGPLILIALGVVFLLGTLGKISMRGLSHWFAYYWPVLLILWGAVKLVEYVWARSKGQAPPRTGAGTIVFVVFFVLFGLTTTSVSRWNWQGIRQELDIDDNSDDFFGIGGTTYEFTETAAQPLAGGTEFKVLARRGSIKITPSPDGQAHLVVHKSVRADSQGGADQVNTSTHPTFIQQGSLWVLDATTGSYEKGRFDLDLQLPRDTSLSLSTRRGDITVINREGTLDASTDHGDVTLEQIKGNTSLHVRSGSASVKGVTGDVMVDGTVEDGKVSDVTGSLDFNAGYNGEVQLAKIGKQVHFKSVRTDLQAPRLDGEINMSSGNIHGTSITGPFRVQTRSNDVRLEDTTGDVRVENRNAVVEITTKAPLGNIDVNNTHGDVTVELPAAANFVVDAESHDGNISSEFSGLNLDNEHRDSKARGTVGKGGPTLRVRADRGTIQIRKK